MTIRLMTLKTTPRGAVTRVATPDIQNLYSLNMINKISHIFSGSSYIQGIPYFCFLSSKNYH